jgi:hypothetical protein
MEEVNAAAEFGKTEDEMFKGYDEPKFSGTLVPMSVVEETRKLYQSKLVECLLHWLEELRNFRELCLDFEAIPAEFREKAREVQGQMKHMREDKKQGKFNELPMEGRKALNLLNALPAKKVEVLKAKRALGHTEAVLRDCDAIIDQKYGRLLQ